MKSTISLCLLLNFGVLFFMFMLHKNVALDVKLFPNFRLNYLENFHLDFSVKIIMAHLT